MCLSRPTEEPLKDELDLLSVPTTIGADVEEVKDQVFPPCGRWLAPGPCESLSAQNHLILGRAIGRRLTSEDQALAANQRGFWASGSRQGKRETQQAGSGGQGAAQLREPWPLRVSSFHIAFFVGAGDNQSLSPLARCGMNYAQILPELLLGSYPRSADDIDRLRQEAVISAVLNLQTDDDLRSLNLSWETLQAHYEACHVDVRRVPVRDFDSTELCSKLPECVRTLDQLLAAGHLVYFHCTAGAGRSPTVAIAYQYRCRGWKLDEASAYVTHRRPCSPNLEVILAADWGHANEEAARPCISSQSS